MGSGKTGMAMEMSWLEDFLELARTGNFSRAAELRHVTQPAFSRRIRALEEWAGVTLFDRALQPVILTDAGRRFQPYAGTVLHDLAQARDEARQAGATSASTLRFAATHALSLIFFSGWLKALEDPGRHWNVHLASDNFTGCESLLLDGKAQLLLCHFHDMVETRLPTEHFISVRVGEDRLVPCAAPALAGEVDAKLTELPLLAYTAHSGLGRILRGVLGPSLPAVLGTPAMTADHAFLLKALCLDGRGLAWLPQSLAAADVADGRLAILGDAAWQIPLDIRLFKSRGAESAAVTAFWEIIARV
jgi:DNA-binding transcriptional LysR family regulator